MKKALLVALLIAVLGLAVSIVLMPQLPEMAMTKFRLRSPEAARASYEAQIKAGRVTPEIMNSLVEMYQEKGDTANAIWVMEQYLTVNPNDLEVRKRLSTLYQQADRQDDYVRNLEEINRIAPNPEILAELSRIYTYRNDYSRQIEALKQLISMDREFNAQHHKDLAILQANQKVNADAINTLFTLKARQPEAYTFAEVELLVGLLIDEKRGEEALAQSVEWKQKGATPEQIARLVAIMRNRGETPLAERLLATYDDATIDSNPALAEQKILLMLETGKEAEAYDRLKQLYAANQITPELRNRLLFLSIARGEEKLTKKLTDELDATTLDEMQAMSLLEVSIARNDMALRQKLNDAFATPEKQASAPLLSALLAATTKAADTEQRFAALDNVQLGTGQILQATRICMKAKDSACTERFLSRLPSADKLTDEEVAAVGNVFFEMKEYDRGYQFMQQLAATRTSPVIEATRIKFAAIKGDFPAVEAWLAQHEADADPRTLRDIYFAASNAKQNKLAARVAELLYTREANADTRSMLASAYVRSGQYAKAVELLRAQSPMTEADENNYFTALSKLAKTSPAYRKELGNYAASRLNANTPPKRKMALLDALVNAGQMDVAMPHLRPLALKHGGKWAWIYAGELTKRGQHEEARQFWVQLASQPSISDAERRTIAKNLLAGGYRADAEPIFRRLAAKSGPNGQATQELLYVWGPLYTPEQLNWLGERYRTAPASDLSGWSHHIATGAATDSIISFAEDRYPETLFAPDVMTAYVTALARRDQLEGKHEALLRGLQEHGDPALLRTYADAAQENGKPRQARQAYEAAVALQPNDMHSLRNISDIAYEQGDYTTSRGALEAYLSQGGAEADSIDNAESAFHRYAELMQREGQKKAASEYYAQSANIVDQASLDAPAALSHKAQALIATGHANEGLATFQEATARYPEDDALLADYIDALISQKRYDEARALLGSPLVRHARLQDAPDSLPFPAGRLADYSVSPDGTQALVELNGSDDDVRQFASNAEALPWVSYSADGYKRVLVSAQPGYILKVENDAQGQQALVAIPADNDPARRDLRLRFEMLAARTEMETGEIVTATQRLNRLVPSYPGNAKLLASAASAENYGGNVHQARNLLQLASAAAPENEDVAALNHQVRMASAPNVKLDHEWIKRDGGNRENITTLSGHMDASSDVVLGFTLQNNRTKVSGAPVPASLTSISDSKNRQRGELYALWHGEDGQRSRVSLFANNDTLGVGANYEFLNILGETGAGIEYRRPYWELVPSSAYFDTTRDRVSIWHTVRPTPEWALSVEPGLNRYSADDRTNIDTSKSVDASIVFRPEAMPYAWFNYGLSGEYMDDKTLRGNRETHHLAANASYSLSSGTTLSGTLGYGFDRVMDTDGPILEGRLTQEFDEAIDGQLRAAYGLDTQQGTEDTARVGGYMRVKF